MRAQKYYVITWLNHSHPIYKDTHKTTGLRCPSSMFRNTPYAFAQCAVELAPLMDGNFISFLARPWRDGGGDAVGTYVIGTEQTSAS